MFVQIFFTLFLACAFIQEARSACQWTGYTGGPGELRWHNEQPECRDKEYAYRPMFTYEAVCDKNIDLDIKPCYIDYHGFHSNLNYVYSLDIILEHPQTHDLFAQNLNQYRDIRVRKLQISKADNMTTVPQEVFDLNHLEILNLSENNIQNIQITSFVRVPGLNILDLSSNKITDVNPVPVNARSNATGLYLKRNRIKTFPVSLLYYFPNLVELHLQYNIIDSVTPADFEGAINLKKLYLSGNKLTSINGDGFQRLSHNLVYLKVTLNSITNLPSQNDITFPKLDKLYASYNQIHDLDSFENFPTIRSIQIDNNNISKISKNMFKTNKKLKWITFGYNPIREIESNSFEKNTKLFHIDMSNTFLVSIQGLTFNGFNKGGGNIDFIDIDLRAGQIVTIEDGAFTGVKGLQRLYLSFNAIKNISSLAFNTLDSLILLDISYNQLETLDIKTNNLKNLEQLYAQHNKIEKISKTVFEHLNALKILDLSYNNVKKIDPEALTNLINLKEISLSNNKEFDVMLNTPLSGLNNLREFSLAETGITTFKNGSITYCNKIYKTTINASFSQIKTIEYNAFEDCECLRTIILSHNKLESFHVNSTSVKNLEELLLDNNHIKNINSYTFNGFNNLRSIYLQINDIVYVDPIAFQNVPKLRILYISTTVTQKPYFKVNALPQSLGILSVENFVFDMFFEDSTNNVHKLHLKSCGIGDLGRFKFSNFPKLKQLNVTSDDISVINHDKLKDLSNLYRLNLSKNKISSIAVDSFSKMSKLYHLDLSENMISSIPKGLFDDQKKFARLSLSSNSLTTFDIKVLPPTANLYLDNNPLTALDFDYVFNSSITKISVGHTVSCENLANVEKNSPQNFNKFVTAEPLIMDVQNVNGIPC